MTIFTVEGIIIGLLGVICTLLSYWAIRLENRIALLATALIDIRERVPKEYVSKEEFRERAIEIFESMIHRMAVTGSYRKSSCPKDKQLL